MANKGESSLPYLIWEKGWECCNLLRVGEGGTYKGKGKGKGKGGSNFAFCLFLFCFVQSHQFKLKIHIVYILKRKNLI